MNVDTPVVCEEPFRESGRPILLLAGPGTGKTYQLARRIQFLVDSKGVSPDAITVITFTREAALAMRAKLNTRGKAEFVEHAKQPTNIKTMHSLGHQIVDENARLVGLHKGVAVVTDPLLKKGLMRDAALLVGLTEGDGLAALNDKETANVQPTVESRKVQEAYSNILRACNAIDFDDQIALACEILATHPDVLAACKNRTRHLLVDEYQDINADQHRLITLLCRDQSDGLFAVGDDDQSIYGFRGGDPTYIRTFSDAYPGASILQLQVSRRCLKNILDCAISVVSRFDTERAPKVAPRYTAEEPGLVQIWNCPSEKREANLIAKAIFAKAASGDAADFFVLVPNRNYVQPLSQALTANGVAHDVGASMASEEWDILSTLKSWLDEPSNLATRHAIELILCAGTTRMPSARVRVDAKKELRHEYASQVARLWEPVLGGNLTLEKSLEDASPASAHLEELWSLTAGIKHAYSNGDVPSFLGAVADGVALFKSIDSFYRCLRALSSDASRGGASPGRVRILTFQSSKGLEAECVFIVGLEEGTIPRDILDAQTTAEAARLVFVAMTRAKRELHLTYARTRTGASTYKPESRQLKPSPFITILPNDQCTTQYVSAGEKKKSA